MPFLYETDLPFSSFSRISNPASSALSSTSARMGGNIAGTRQQQSRGNISVAQALEIARDSAEGAQDPTIIYILESALSDIWRRIQAHPSSYVMTREEFAVFNYFQHRFVGHDLAVAARKRYWDHLHLSNNG